MTEYAAASNERDEKIKKILGSKLEDLDKDLDSLGEGAVKSVAEAREAQLAWEGMDAKEGVSIAISLVAMVAAVIAALSTNSSEARALYISAGVAVLAFGFRALIALWRRKRVMIAAVISYRDEKSNALSHH